MSMPLAPNAEQLMIAWKHGEVRIIKKFLTMLERLQEWDGF